MVDLALTDNWLLDASDVGRASLRLDVHGDFQGDVPVQVHGWLDVDIHANIKVLKLRVDQGIDANASNAGLKRPGRHRNAGTNLETCLLSVRGTNLRILQELHVGI